ncbi:MAG: metabolite traffic protein EboE [Phycisphaerales bacterium]
MEPAYCTNVVAGHSLQETRTHLERVFAAVRQHVAPGGVLPLGLWLSARAAHDLCAEPDGPRRLRDWLAHHGLAVVTLNAFPYADFHGPVVKQQVYVPSWADSRRLLYTVQLAELLPELLPPGATHASISTVPLGWRPAFLAEHDGAAMGVASAHLEQLVRHLARVEDRTGVRVHVDLEPEPGCMLQRAEDVTGFFASALVERRGQPDPRRYIGVCHDVCHAAVMFEGQQEVLRAYRQAGIRVGKVQISSAPCCSGAPDELAVLASFAEARYLHQTCVRAMGRMHFFEDLPRALAEAPPGEWRTHFHVPVFAARLGALATTQAQIRECLAVTTQWSADEEPQYEVETYAWDVLPPSAAGLAEDAGRPGGRGQLHGAANTGSAAADLTAGIARELRWTIQALAEARQAAAGAADHPRAPGM